MNTVLHSYNLSLGYTLELVQGDITIKPVHAIVNAANSQLLHVGGLAAIIANKGGQAIHQESQAWVQEHGPVAHDHPAYTSGGNLPFKYIIHAVGPVWGDGDEDAKLSSAIAGALHLADKLELKSIAFPAISTGIFGFPKDRAAGIIYQAIIEYFAKEADSSINQVRVTVFDQETIDAFKKVWQRVLTTS